MKYLIPSFLNEHKILTKIIDSPPLKAFKAVLRKLCFKKILVYFSK